MIYAKDRITELAERNSGVSVILSTACSIQLKLLAGHKEYYLQCKLYWQKLFIPYLNSMSQDTILFSLHTHTVHAHTHIHTLLASH